MNQMPPPTSPDTDLLSFAELMRRLGETFIVRDVMVKLGRIRYVAPGDVSAAVQIVEQERYSAVPTSIDGQKFDSVFWTDHPPTSVRTITEERRTTIEDFIPDSTPLAEAFSLFESREWYLTLRGNRVSGLVTYWDFNSHEFRVQLYVGFSRVEELSRDVLAKDGCGVSSRQGLNLTDEVLDKVSERFESAKQELGGNRFVDELQFHHVYDALKKHTPWREQLHQRLGQSLSNGEYDRRYDFTTLRDAVMHGRVLFPTYRRFKECTRIIGKIPELIGYLEAYIGPPTG